MYRIEVQVAMTSSHRYFVNLNAGLIAAARVAIKVMDERLGSIGHVNCPCVVPGRRAGEYLVCDDDEVVFARIRVEEMNMEEWE